MCRLGKAFFLRTKAVMIIYWLCGWVHAASIAVPAPLEPWRAWVLDQHRDLSCPFVYTNAEQRYCRWPGALELRADDRGASFHQTWQLYRDGWIALPGDDDYWPQEVMVDGQLAAVVARDGTPAVWLTPGEHRVQGVLRWNRLPTRLALPADTGLLSVSLRGQALAQPSIDAQGALLLGERSTAVAAADSLQVQVFRQLQDGIPLTMETVLRLRVAGQAREVVLGQFLLDGFAPLSLETPLPARIEPDGRLRVQLRAGEWELVLQARALGQPLRFASKKMTDAWPDEEIWSWRDDRRLRQVTPSAPSAMDPSQTDMPEAWRQAPAWLLREGETLALTEVQRGQVLAAGADASETLSLQRELWLDFDGGGITSRDTVSGGLQQSRRLSAAAHYQPGRVEVNSEPRLITRLEGQQTEAGIELRSGPVSLMSIGRSERAARIPVTAWQHDMSRVAATLHLPPGWMLLHADGADYAVGSWLSQWNLWAIFLVLMVTALAVRLLGIGGGVIGLLALVLSYQASHTGLLVWLMGLVGVSVQRALPHGWLRRVLAVGNAVILGALLLLLLNFAVSQARSAVYPQLELGRYATIEQGAGLLPSAVDEQVMSAEMAVTADASAAREVASPAPVSKRARSLYDGPDEPAPRAIKAGYDSNAQVQTGPGEPAWRWRQVTLGWSGPVLQSQTMQWYLVSPGWQRLWRLAAVLLSFVFLALTFKAAWPVAQWRSWVGRSSAASLLVLGILALPAQPVWAQTASAFPDPALLKDLEQRLTRAPDCVPQCASVSTGAVTVAERALRVDLQIAASEPVAVPLPAARGQWLPRTVLVDGNVSANLRQDEQGVLWLALPAGSHTVTLEGVIDGQTLQLPFPMPVHNLVMQAEGWQVSGLQNGRVPSGNVQLSRDMPQQATQAESTRLLPDVAPPFLRVTRTLVLGLDWQVNTVVERIAPVSGAINTTVPLLTGEAVLTSGVEVRDGKVTVAMSADTASLAWTSSLQPAAELQLTAASDAPWVEQWQWEVAPLWHVDFSGLNPIKQESRSGVLPTWQPWPGESLKAVVSRPQAVVGNTRTVESTTLEYRPGMRSADTTLTLQVRSSQGGEMPLALPVGAQLQRITIDGVEQSSPAVPDARLKLPLRPGVQQVAVSWRQEQALAWRIHTPLPQIDEALSNIHLKMQLPEGRWLLAVGGPAMGPALLYWGVLVVMLLVAVLLGRSGLAPVATWQWLLLGLGMSTVNAVGSVLVVLWFVAMARRRTMAVSQLSVSNFQLVQILLVLLSLLALGSLLGTIPASLLSTPDMQVVGNQSTLYALHWYQDRSVSGLPAAWAISVPMWVYRAAMLLWSLWLVFSLMAWCRWGWQCFGAGELWRSTLPGKKNNGGKTEEPVDSQ